MTGLDVTKFFGAEVGALTNWDEKEARYIVNGVHDADKLQTLLDGFIKKFVLCPKCDNPETDLSVKNGVIFRTCKACGAKNPCDNLHKLATFIKNNPPPKPIKLKQAKDTATANIQQSSGAGGSDEVVEGMVAPEGFDDGLKQSEDVQVDEDDWDEAAAQANRESELAGLSERVKNSLSLNKEVEDFQDPLEAFAQFIESRPDLTAETVVGEISERAIRSDKAVAVVTQILLSEELLKRLKQHEQIFRKILVSEADKLAFLGSLERLCIAHQQVKQIPAILQAAYMADLVDEEVLEVWREKPSKKFVSKDDAKLIRTAAKPFFNWLQEDESDESGESDSE